MITLDGRSYLDVHEAAARLGVKPETLYAYVSRGVLRSYRQGIRRRRLYLLDDIDELLKLRAADEPAPADSNAARTAVLPPKPTDQTGRDAPALPLADAWASER